MSMKPDDILRDLSVRISKAVAHYWKTRMGQRDKQRRTGKADQGLRSAVTGDAPRHRAAPEPHRGISSAARTPSVAADRTLCTGTTGRTAGCVSS